MKSKLASLLGCGVGFAAVACTLDEESRALESSRSSEENRALRVDFNADGVADILWNYDRMADGWLDRS